jgi:hypothetical protein
MRIQLIVQADWYSAIDIDNAKTNFINSRVKLKDAENPTPNIWMKMKNPLANTSSEMNMKMSPFVVI